MHATAVLIGAGEGRGLLIRGASGAGKSALALALIRAATPARPVALVGDDRLVLRRDAASPGAIVARPHPRIAGFIERRGLGLVAVPWRARVFLAGRVDIDAPAGPGGEAEDWLRALPLLTLGALPAGGAEAAARRVLAWWTARAVATDGTQVA